MEGGSDGTCVLRARTESDGGMSECVCVCVCVCVCGRARLIQRNIPTNETVRNRDVFASLREVSRASSRASWQALQMDLRRTSIRLTWMPLCEECKALQAARAVYAYAPNHLATARRSRFRRCCCRKCSMRTCCIWSFMARTYGVSMNERALAMVCSTAGLPLANART